MTNCARSVLRMTKAPRRASCIITTHSHIPIHHCTNGQRAWIHFTSVTVYTHGEGWRASWPSGWSCCRRCGCGRRPWPRSERNARFSSLSPSRSNPHSARTEAAGDPGSWGTSLLSSPSRQTPSQDTTTGRSWKLDKFCRVLFHESFHHHDMFMCGEQQQANMEEGFKGRSVNISRFILC